MPKPGPQQRIEIDDGWLLQWVEYGMTELRTYLWKIDEFARWCAEHGRDV